MIQEYKKYEFCVDVNCDLLMFSCHAGDACPFSAKKFHKWLKDNGFKIVKISSKHRTVAQQLADSIEIYLAIVSAVIRDGLPVKKSNLIIKVINNCIADRALRHSVFNHIQMRKNGFDRIN